jgi:sec-independent protein translocase protein TatA
VGNVGPLEVAVVLIIALIIFGPKRVPELGKSLGKGVRNFKSALDGEDDDTGEKPDRVESNRLPVSSELPAAAEADAAEVKAPVKSHP